MRLPDNLLVRPMTAGDLDSVMTIEQASASAPHWNIAGYITLIETDTEAFFKRNAMVVEADLEVVGFAIFRLVGGSAGAELESIVIAADWRRRGVGGLLLSELARQAKELGAGQLDLEVRESNAAAIGLYRAVGFLKTGHRRAYYRDPEEDAVLMSVTL